MSNHLHGQSSPYLLQHADNPVDWYPWCQEAFDKASKEDKPVFLSIGYSTCHWCHVMAHESFEDADIAELLNRYYICVKVDKEERPDIDSVYMRVCQAFTGSGGWPTTIIMTSDQKPFFAGTYLPKTSHHGIPGLTELLLAVHEKWQSDRAELLFSSNEIVRVLSAEQSGAYGADEKLLERAVSLYRRNFDSAFGGFGDAPKFPAPHNLLFLMRYYEQSGEVDALTMAEKTLVHLYRGGVFDHIGYGFCRYSTDRSYLVPHFEKMLYDNALLIIAYCRAFELTKKPIYKEVAQKTSTYVLSEMRSDGGGFYSAQDADSDGEEGKYYTFKPTELERLLGESTARSFSAYYGITDAGNFNGKSIPNLLNTDEFTDEFDVYLSSLRDYRRKRAHLNTDDKILTSWNALMIAALCNMYRISRERKYLNAAIDARSFIDENLCDGRSLYVSFRDGKKSGKGYLDDYAGYIFALLALYDVTFDESCMMRASSLCTKALDDFYDAQNGGFFQYGDENESLILRPKETYDGAIPSGNSFMAYDLLKLNFLIPDDRTGAALKRQMDFMSAQAKDHPYGYSMFLTALSYYLDPPVTVTAVKKGGELSSLAPRIASDVFVRVLNEPTPEYKLVNDETTFYVCADHACMPPVNERDFLSLISN